MRVLKLASRVRIECGYRTLERIKFSREFLTGRQRHAETDESPHDVDAHLNGARTVENRRGHDRTMLGEGKRQVLPVTTMLKS